MNRCSHSVIALHLQSETTIDYLYTLCRCTVEMYDICMLLICPSILCMQDEFRCDLVTTDIYHYISVEQETWTKRMENYYCCSFRIRLLGTVVIKVLLGCFQQAWFSLWFSLFSSCFWLWDICIQLYFWIACKNVTNDKINDNDNDNKSFK